MKKKKIKLKDIARIILLILCGRVLGMNLYLANANKLVGNQMPTPFGYGAAVVLSGSMEPALSVGDLIIVSESKPYAENDIVVFQDGGSLVVHRVVSVDAETVITQGDANNVADDPISKSSVKGTVVAVVPQVGGLVSFIKTPIGTILFVALAVLLVELPYRKEKQKDDEEIQQLIEKLKRLEIEK